MEWTPAMLWLAAALALGLAELTSGALLLLALAIAAALTAAATAIFWLPLSGQLLAMGVLTGVLVPLTIKVIRPRFSPKGVAYGTTGTGAQQGRHYLTLNRDFDGASGLKINGDFYRLRVADSTTTRLPPGTDVIFKEFDGTTAIVTLASAGTPSQEQ